MYLQRGVAGRVADRIRIDLAGAEAVEEALRETAGEQRAGAGVVRMPDGLRAMSRDNVLEASRDLAGAWSQPIASKRPSPLGPTRFMGRVHPRLGIEPGAVVGDRALAAQRAARHRMSGSPSTFTRPSARFTTAMPHAS
jgi:hypothetical protein